MVHTLFVCELAMKWWALGSLLGLGSVLAIADSAQTPLFYETQAQISSPIIFESGGGFNPTPTIQPIIAVIQKTNYSTLVLLVVTLILVCSFLIWSRRKKRKEDQSLETEQSPTKEVEIL